MEPRPPRRKKFNKGTPEHTLPIIETINGPYKFTGVYDNFSVVIKKQSEMEKINKMGSFGKGSLSRNFPTYNNIQIPILRKRQYDKYCELITKISSPSPDIFHSLKDGKLQREKELFLECKSVIQVNDSDSEAENNYLDSLKCELFPPQKLPFVENLRLSLEEAFYLQMKNCLQIRTLNNQILQKFEAWDVFSRSQKSFIQNFVVYNYFRERGWVVKPGLKFGGDFLLYKDGPAHYHASFLVVIDVVKSDTKKRFEELCTRSMDWTSLTCLDRMIETAAKELLIAQVSWPENLSIEESHSTPCISSFEVTSLLVRRWVPKSERMKFPKNNQWKNIKK